MISDKCVSNLRFRTDNILPLRMINGIDVLLPSGFFSGFADPLTFSRGSGLVAKVDQARRHGAY